MPSVLGYMLVRLLFLLQIFRWVYSVHDLSGYAHMSLTYCLFLLNVQVVRISHWLGVVILYLCSWGFLNLPATRLKSYSLYVFPQFHRSLEITLASLVSNSPLFMVYVLLREGKKAYWDLFSYSLHDVWYSDIDMCL
jgi:hypothetical protein